MMGIHGILTRDMYLEDIEQQPISDKERKHNMMEHYYYSIFSLLYIVALSIYLSISRSLSLALELTERDTQSELSLSLSLSLSLYIYLYLSRLKNSLQCALLLLACIFTFYKSKLTPQPRPSIGAPRTRAPSISPPIASRRRTLLTDLSIFPSSTLHQPPTVHGELSVSALVRVRRPTPSGVPLGLRPPVSATVPACYFLSPSKSSTTSTPSRAAMRPSRAHYIFFEFWPSLSMANLDSFLWSRLYI